MTVLEILKAARELLIDEKRWTKGAYARDARGVKVAPSSPVAVCFCVMGALVRASKAHCGADFFDTEATLIDAGHEINEFHVPTWQDAPERTHAEVLARFDEAIARLEAAP